MFIEPKEGRTFGDISSLYDTARTTYPDTLIEDIVSYAKIRNNGNVLDVGCGTGKTTLPFAQKGYSVTGLDISKEMIRRAEERCSSFPKVNFKIGTFENFPSSPALFDLIISGMAWHWIHPQEREEKAHRILKNGGTLALFWSYQRKEDSDFVMNASKILDRYGGPDRGPAGSRVKQIADSLHTKLREERLFSDIEMKTYKEDLEFSKQRYLDLVVSYGWVQGLSKEARGSMLQDLQGLCYEEPLQIPYQHLSLLA